MKIDLIGRVVSAVLLIALPLVSLYENKVFFARDIYRTCFGWQVPNGMGFSFTVMTLEWMYLRHRRFRWYDYAGILAEYSCAMKSHFRKLGNQMSGSGNHLYNYAILLA